MGAFLYYRVCEVSVSFAKSRLLAPFEIMVFDRDCLMSAYQRQECVRPKLACGRNEE